MVRKTILITGASSGLGAQMARQFAARGRNLALCARRTDRLYELKVELEAQHQVRVEVRDLDVNEHGAVFAVFDDFAQAFGRIDRFVVNAGIGRGRPLGTGHFEENRSTVETNFVAGLAQCEAALRLLRAQSDGHLVVISSMSAVRGLPKHYTAYAASKAAIAHLAEGLRVEMAGTGIVVSTIFPGYIRTAINQNAKKNLPFAVDEVTGAKALVRAIEREPATARVPAWPWSVVGHVMRVVPARFLV